MKMHPFARLPRKPKLSFKEERPDLGGVFGGMMLGVAPENFPHHALV